MTQVHEGGQLYEVHKQWLKRPDDQRVLSLYEARDKVKARTERAQVLLADTKKLSFYANDDKETMVLDSPMGPKFLTHWSFSQLCGLLSAPGSFLRTVRAEFVAGILNDRLEHGERENVRLFADAGTSEMRGVNSPSYGWVHDLDVTNALIDMNVRCGERWKIPYASYQATDPLRATTLYVGDRDIFFFLCDAEHPVEVKGQQLFRGFYVANSEVGARKLVVAAFLYVRACDNRIIWGVSGFKEIAIRHNSGAPERFLREVQPLLLEYANASAKPVENQIVAAQEKRAGRNREEVQEFLQKFGLSANLAGRVIDTAKKEEGDFRRIWDVTQGITAVARDIRYADERVDLERVAGRILDATVGEK